MPKNSFIPYFLFLAFALPTISPTVGFCMEKQKELISPSNFERKLQASWQGFKDGSMSNIKKHWHYDTGIGMVLAAATFIAWTLAENNRLRNWLMSLEKINPDNRAWYQNVFVKLASASPAFVSSIWQVAEQSADSLNKKLILHKNIPPKYIAALIALIMPFVADAGIGATKGAMSGYSEAGKQIEKEKEQIEKSKEEDDEKKRIEEEKRKLEKQKKQDEEEEYKKFLKKHELPEEILKKIEDNQEIRINISSASNVNNTNPKKASIMQINGLEGYFVKGKADRVVNAEKMDKYMVIFKLDLLGVPKKCLYEENVVFAQKIDGEAPKKNSVNLQEAQQLIKLLEHTGFIDFYGGVNLLREKNTNKLVFIDTENAAFFQAPIKKKNFLNHDMLEIVTKFWFDPEALEWFVKYKKENIKNEEIIMPLPLQKTYFLK